MRWLVVITVLGLTGIASAQNPSTELTREFQAGVDAFRLGNYNEARAHLEKAKQLDPRLAGPHRFLAAVAQAQQRWDDCIAAARAALKLNPVSQELADTRKLHDDCRASAGRAAYRGGELGEGAALSVTTNIPSATVKIRGLTYGGTPISPRPITPGRLAIDIEKHGYLTARIDIDALPGIVTDVIVDLEPGAEPTTTPIKPKTGWLVVPPGAPTRQIEVDGVLVVLQGDRVELAPGIHVVEVREPTKDPWRRRIAITADYETPVTPAFVDTGPRESQRRRGVMLVGGGAALAVLGIVTFYASRNAAEDARDILRIEIARPPGDTTAPLRTRADFEDARSRANTWRTISNLSYAAALITGGIGGYFLYRGRTPSDDAPEFAIAPISGGAMVTGQATW